MAEKKKTNTRSTKSIPKEPAPAKVERHKLGDDIIPSASHAKKQEKPLKMPGNPDSPGNQLMLCAIALMGILLLACFLMTDMELRTVGLTGPVGYYVCCGFYGLFGIGAYVAPVMILIYAAMWKHSVRRGKTGTKAMLCVLLTVLVSAVAHLAFASVGTSAAQAIRFYDFGALWNSGAELQSGGVLGGFIGALLKTCLNVIAWPVIIFVILGVIMWMFEITPNMIAYCVRQASQNASESRKVKRQHKRGIKAEKAEMRRTEKAQQEQERARRRLEKQEEIAERERIFYQEHEKKRTLTDISLEGEPTVETANKSTQNISKNSPQAVRESKTRKAEPAPERKVSQTPVQNLQEQVILPEIETGRASVEPVIPVQAVNTLSSFDEEIIKPSKEKKTTQTQIAFAEEEKPKRTVKDVDINDVFDEDKRTNNFGFKGRTDINGNERTDLDPQQGSDISIDDPGIKSADEKEIDQLLDTLGEGIFEDDPYEDILRQDEETDRTEEFEKMKTTKKKSEGVKATREKVLPVEEFTDEPYNLPQEPEKPSYVLPPITLLDAGSVSADTGYSDEVLERNGRRLVETLKSFRVDVEIGHISKGPTITRYELVPKAGVRVRSIANLVDDIALALETQGIRIEAPIPGKAAVGIEVPNKNLATVYLRSLIDTDAFRNHKSKINCCLGKNVSGEPVYLDIAKMPHLLIAGATGMGKSVCINSLLISLLYKATPDEVKLILIDPKKVELNVYNKLPHLLVPVVNQPKMAAGSLAWAVGEMERRFELIEEVGVRDVAGYNKITANDPQKEFLPQIVIVIDELADLMMTAPVEVEQSIIRLAQKARAAGMHLIIGTQRPSVDVITGLIKANIPSRIAFTVASNVDSRTIIDVAGAEKLIGRGDMLYAPVGAMKPARVQGSFVSDSEVERVTEFIKAQIKGDYDQQIIKEIDRNAKQCGQKKKSEPELESGADSGELDEKFYEAVDVALEEGKVSTSLLQRRISVGYGRAAKMIDTMQRMGIVSPPDGQKPRTTLITRQDWDEKLMRSDSNVSAPADGGDFADLPGDDEYDDDAPF